MEEMAKKKNKPIVRYKHPICLIWTIPFFLLVWTLFLVACVIFSVIGTYKFVESLCVINEDEDRIRKEWNDILKGAEMTI